MVVTIDSCQQVNNIKVNPIIDFYTVHVVVKVSWFFSSSFALIVLVVD